MRLTSFEIWLVVNEVMLNNRRKILFSLVTVLSEGNRALSLDKALQISVEEKMSVFLLEKWNLLVKVRLG